MRLHPHKFLKNHNYQLNYRHYIFLRSSSNSTSLLNISLSAARALLWFTLGIPFSSTLKYILKGGIVEPSMNSSGVYSVNSKSSSSVCHAITKRKCSGVINACLHSVSVAAPNPPPILLRFAAFISKKYYSAFLHAIMSEGLLAILISSYPLFLRILTYSDFALISDLLLYVFD